MAAGGLQHCSNAPELPTTLIRLDLPTIIRPCWWIAGRQAVPSPMAAAAPLAL